MSGWIDCLAGIGVGGALVAAQYAARRVRQHHHQHHVRRTH